MYACTTSVFPGFFSASFCETLATTQGLTRMLTAQEFTTDFALQVEYAGRIYSRAGLVENNWYWLDSSTDEIHRFRLQHCVRVVTAAQNP
jgi:hypothetical protein